MHDCKPAAIVEKDKASSEALPTPSRKRKFDQDGPRNALPHPPVPKVTACPYHLQFLSQLNQDIKRHVQSASASSGGGDPTTAAEQQPAALPDRAQPPALPKSSRALVGIPPENTKDQTTAAEQQQAALPYGKAAVIQFYRYEEGKLKEFHDEHYNPTIEKLEAAAKVSQSTKSHYGNNKHKSKCIYSGCDKDHKPTKKVHHGLCGTHFKSLITGMTLHEIISAEAEYYMRGSSRAKHATAFQFS